LDTYSREILVRTFNVLSNDKRIYALELFSQNKELQEITKLTEMSRSGFQKIVDAFRDFGLIESTGHRSRYRLSRKGSMILGMIREFSEKLKSAETEYEKLRVREDILHSPLTVKELEEIMKELKEKGK
jgi:predicted transcriptional regulator